MSTDHDHVVDAPPHATPDATLAALTTDVACVWWQTTRFLEVAGDDAEHFLDGVLTQDIAGIPDGHSRLALALTAKAAIIAPMIAHRPRPGCVLLEHLPEHADEIIAHLRRYRLRARVTVEPTELGTITLLGPRAEVEMGSRDGLDDAVWWFGSPAWGVDARTAIGSRAAIHALVGSFEVGDMVMADPETVDAVRIDAGVPSFDDLVVGRMPAEVGAEDHAISFDKGCYIGQEPVARLHWRGRSNRSLRRVDLSRPLADDDVLDGPDASLAIAARATPDRALGTLTTWATHPDGRITGLAILRREVFRGDLLLVTGTEVDVIVVDDPPADRST